MIRYGILLRGANTVLCPVIPLDKEEPCGGKMLSRTWLSTSFVIKESLMITVFINGQVSDVTQELDQIYGLLDAVAVETLITEVTSING